MPSGPCLWPMPLLGYSGPRHWPCIRSARGFSPWRAVFATTHAIKQVDRRLSNEGIDIDAALRHWVPYVVGSRTSINVALDWTDFDADGQATLMLSLLTRHGRATPLLWLTVETASLKNHRNVYEYQALARLADALVSDTKVCIVADRGFGDQKL